MSPRPTKAAIESQEDDVFGALANAQRRRMLDVLVDAPGINVKTLASQFAISRVAVLKHLAVLENAGLVLSEQDGRSRRLWFNHVPIQRIHERWTTRYGARWSSGLLDLQERVEARTRARSRRHA